MMTGKRKSHVKDGKTRAEKVILAHEGCKARGIIDT